MMAKFHLYKKKIALQNIYEGKYLVEFNKKAAQYTSNPNRYFIFLLRFLFLETHTIYCKNGLIT